MFVSTTIHFALITITVCVAGVIMGWFRDWPSIVGTLISFTVVYMLIWVSMYLFERRIAAQATQRLHEDEVEETQKKNEA